MAESTTEMFADGIFATNDNLGTEAAASMPGESTTKTTANDPPSLARL